MNINFKFRGRFTHTLDDKGRLTLPGRLKEELRKSQFPEEITISSRSEGYLALYPFEQWLLIEDSLSGITDIRVRESFTRRYISTAETLSLDKTGRILLPSNFREDASLGREVIVLGGMHKIELWARERLEAQQIIDDAIFEGSLANLTVPL